MPKYRTAAIMTLVAVATLGIDTVPVSAEQIHGPTHASVTQLPGQIAKSARNGSPPAQIGNIWCGFDHQPTSSELQDREEAAGISISAAQQEREIAILNDIYKHLMSLPRSAAAQ
jgi:hypothetical protein